MSNAAPRDRLIVTAKEVLAGKTGKPTVILDVRIGDAEKARAAYREAHIPGAWPTTVAADFAGKPTDESGNLPLPEPADLQGALERWGVTPETHVVVYSDNPAAAARAWWVLRWAGVEKTRILDGGLKAWIEAGGSVETGEGPAGSRPSGDTLQVSPGQLPELQYGDVEDFARVGLLLDSRPAAAFGDEAVPTHIPGARSLPAEKAWDENGKLRADEELRALFRATADEGGPVGAYCGGGVLAAYEVLALKAIGVDAALYVGSWSEWSKRQAANEGNGR